MKTIKQYHKDTGIPLRTIYDRIKRGKMETVTVPTEVCYTKNVVYVKES